MPCAGPRPSTAGSRSIRAPERSALGPDGAGRSGPRGAMAGTAGRLDYAVRPSASAARCGGHSSSRPRSLGLRTGERLEEF
jgi:hypothetical protein